MDKYFQTNLGCLYNKNAFELISHLNSKDKTVQLIFADPPYNMNKADWDYFDSKEDYLDWMVHWIKEAGKILVDDGSMYVMGLSEKLADVKYHIEQRCNWIHSIRWLTWHYKNKPQMSDNGWTRSQESILWIKKSENYKFRMDRIRIPYNNHTQKYPERKQGKNSQFGSDDEYKWDPDVQGAKPRDVIDVPTVNNASKERTKHPTQKPEELLRKIIWSNTDKNDLVFDPFGGSGTTFATCEQLCRKWIGSELSEEYCNIIKNRIESIEHHKESEYWMKHDIDRRKNRREIRYG